jgi:hypothetical protein
MTEEEKAAAAAAQASTTTQVEEVDFDNLDELLGIDSAAILTGNSSSSEQRPNSVLDSGRVNTDFLDDDLDGTPDALKDLSDDKIKDVVTATLDADLTDAGDNEPVEKNKGGRPTLAKDAMIEAAKSLIEDGVLQPFEDDKPLEEYTLADFKELIQENIAHQASTAAQNAPVELFKQLPEEVQAVVHYALNGGQDTKAVFQQLAKVQETFDLDVNNEKDQEEIIRQWYKTSNTFDSPEEIEDEINVLKDRGDIQKFAERYKPKLDAKQAEVVEKRLKDQQDSKKRKEEAQQHYVSTIQKTLSNTQLNGIPLSSKVQNMLYYGLTDSTKYQTAEGKPTNALGYLLEQHQFGKNANPSLVAEALWLLADPEDYRNNVKKLGSKEANVKTQRMLKTEEASRQASSVSSDPKDGSNNRSTLKKPARNIFQR